ncbi:hypothetical protein ACIBG8_12600 [Nonomuraea sp. NPDC050556]|uniref:hypothetical protein n=1 Tax=Nonomuraea sp. NPDC050556 TaxID=3364369 RepID=UPI0037B4EB91
MISRALVIYLTSTPWPSRNGEAVAQALGPELLPALDALVQEMVAIPVDWENHTLESGTAWAREEMRRRHPDLTDEAVAALGGYFAYQWK